MLRCRSLWLGALAACLIVAQARGVDFEVSNGGSDTAACGVGPFTLPPSKCKTIGFAVGTRATAAPDRALVMDGTYDTAAGEAFPITLKDGVSIIGNNAMPQNVRVDSGGSADVFASSSTLSSSTIISGMTITPGSTNTSFAGLRMDVSGTEAATAIIEHNRFVGGRRGIDADNFGGAAILSPTVRNNTFVMQSSDAMFFSADNPGSNQQMSPTITGNVIDLTGANASVGVHIDVSDSISGVIAPTVSNNTIIDAKSDAIRIHATDVDSNSDANITFSPTIMGNTITSAGNNGIMVEITSWTSTNTNDVVVFKPTIGGNTIDGSNDDGIRVRITEIDGSADSMDLSVDISVTNNMVTGSGADGVKVLIGSELDDMDRAKVKLAVAVSGNTVSGSGDDGIAASFNSWEDLDTATVTVGATIANNTVVGNGADGIRLRASDWSSIADNGGSLAPFAPTISGNTVSNNGGAGIVAEAIDISDSASGFVFSPMLLNNTVSGNASLNSGMEIRYTDTLAGGTAMVSGNQIVNNSGTGVLIEIDNSGSPTAANVALRNNTVSGNGGDAVKVFGGVAATFSTINSTTIFFDTPANGNYAVDLGGGFKGGDGHNVILGNTSGTGGSCASGGFCDINNNGPEDVAALCNHFTSSDVTDPTGAEEDFLNDDDDDAARGEIVPISSCQAAACATDADCDDSDVNTCDLCNPVTNLCVYFAVGGGCNDFNSCTIDDQCSGGVCTGTPRAAGNLCRASTGECDRPEICDGTTLPCPPDSLEPSSTVCRPAVNTCDLAENCTGSSATCPPDAMLPDGATCTAEGNVCSVGTCATNRAFVGFTAATGGGFETHDILSWTFTGGSISFPDFSSIAGLNLVADAAQAGSVLRLTMSDFSQVGAAWFTIQQEVQTGFDTTFQFQMTNPGGQAAADGLAFVIQDSPGGVTALGAAGGSIGYANPGGISNSLAVEFDTFDNGEPDIPHVSVHTAGMLPNDADESFSLGRVPFAAMTDGNPHTARITYTPGTMQIFLDGAASADLTVSVDLATLGLAFECANQAAGNAGVECRAVAGACDVAEQCDGISSVCPPDAVQPASAVCRPAADACDLAENCDGTNTPCPADMLAPAGTDCIDDANVCTKDQCDGAGACLHAPRCPEEDTFGAASCGDGLDSDNDGLIDCADPDCAFVAPCSAPAPVLSLPATGLLAALLGLVGLLGVTRLRRTR